MQPHFEDARPAGAPGPAAPQYPVPDSLRDSVRAPRRPPDSGRPTVEFRFDPTAVRPVDEVDPALIEAEPALRTARLPHLARRSWADGLPPVPAKGAQLGAIDPDGVDLPPRGRHRSGGTRRWPWVAAALAVVVIAGTVVVVAGGRGVAPGPPVTAPTLANVTPTALQTTTDLQSTTDLQTTTATPGRTPSTTAKPTPTVTATPAAATSAPPTTPPPTTPAPTTPPPTGPAVVAVRPGTLVVTGITSGRCLDNSANRSTDGNRVQLWECNLTGAQNWAFGADGTMRTAGYCLRPAGGPPGSGTLMQIRACDGGAYQSWQFRSDQSIFNPGAGLCLTDPRTTDPHNQLTLATCTGDQGQRWSYAPQT